MTLTFLSWVGTHGISQIFHIFWYRAPLWARISDSKSVRSGPKFCVDSYAKIKNSHLGTPDTEPIDFLSKIENFYF